MSLEQFTGMHVATAEAASPTSVAAPAPEAKSTPDAAADATPASEATPAASKRPDAIESVTPGAKAEAEVIEAEADMAIEYPAPGTLTLDLTLPDIAPLPMPRPPQRLVVHRTPEEICNTLTKAAEENSLPAPFFIRLLFQESRFKPGVVSPAGALGIAQFMPATSASMGVENPFDPLEAIPASARLLRELFAQFGNLGLAAAAYNAGPKRVQNWLTKKASLPAETRGYVQIVTGRKAENWKGAAEAAHGEQRLPRLAPCQDAAGLYAWDGPEKIPVPTASPLRAAEATRIADASSAESESHDTADGKAETANKTAAKSVKPATKSAARKQSARKIAGRKSTARRQVARKAGATKTAARSHRKGAVQLAARERRHRDRRTKR